MGLKKFGRLEKIAFIFGYAMFLLITLNALFTSAIDQKKSAFVTQTFDRIEKTFSKGDISYDLYTYENKEGLKISADWSKCFYYDDFQNDVTSGQIIKISLSKTGFFRPSVSSIIVDGKNYLFVDCINADIKSAKTTMPMLLFIVTIIALGVYQYNKENHQRSKKPQTIKHQP